MRPPRSWLPATSSWSFDHATILQITGYLSNSTTVVHDTGIGNPGNCSNGLGYPVLCGTNGNYYDFQNNARVAVLTANVWYIGANPVGGTSLYRVSVGRGSNGMPGPPQEMARNVLDMRALYLEPPGTAFSLATSITNWVAVNAVQITLTVQSAYQRAGMNELPLKRTFTSTTTVRNRVL